MPSIINSDDGVVSGTSGLKTTGGNDGLLNIQTNGSTAISISSGQRSTFPTTIGVGNATPSTSGSGITFPATQSASSDANTLDDYEEGTWTPSDQSGAGLSFSNTSGNCLYTKTGRTVVASFRVTYPSTSNGSFAYIGGLPFAAANTTVNVQGASFIENNYAAGATATINVNETRALVLSTSGGAVLIATNANLSGKDLRGVFVYQV